MRDKLKVALYNIGYILLVVAFMLAFMLFITSWLWLPPLWAKLAYDDWSCAYKKCVVVKEEE